MAFDPSTARLLDDSKPSGKFDPSTATLMPEPAKPEGGLIASLKQTVGQGIKGAGQAAADYLPGVTQDNALKSYGQEVIDANPTAVRSLSDVTDSPWTATKEAVGNALGSMGAMVGAQALGRGVEAVAPFTGPARPIVSLLGKGIQFAGPVAAAALPSYGGIREQQIQDDPTRADSPEAKARALAGAGAVGLIERSFGPEKLALSAMTKEGRAKVIESMAGKSLAGSIGKGMAKGAAVEGAEELVQNPVEQFAGYQDPTTPENLQETAFGGVMGALGGGVLGGAGGGISYAARPEQPQVDPNAGPLSRAAATAQQTGAAQTEQARQAAQQADAAATAPAAGETRQGAANAAQAGLSAEAFRQQPDVPPAGSFSGMNEFADFIAQERADLEQRRNPPPFEEMKGVEAGFDPMSRARNQVPPASGSFGAMNEFADLLGQEQADVQQRRDAIAQTQGLQRDSRLESIGNEIDANRQQQTAQARRSLLDQLDADPETVNLLPRFESMLKKQGYAQRRATPEERELIVRRMDARAALVNADQEPVAPNELDAAAMGIRERQPKVRQPQQAPAEKPARAAFPMTQTGAQRQAAERTQATGQAFEVVPHPTVKGRFAVQAVADQVRDAANTSPERVAQTPEIEQVAPDLDGGKIDSEWTAFAADSGTLGIPRAEMPQIKAEHRGALTNFMNARGIKTQQEEVPAGALNPTQAEFSPSKVKRAQENGNGDRSILVSSDNYVLDGHHQWLAKRDAGEKVKVTRLKAPIRQLIDLAHEFPSSATAEGFAQPQTNTDAQQAAQGTANEKAPQALPSTQERGTAQQAEVTPFDHGMLNLPLSKRMGDIDAQLDRYKRDQAAQAKQQAKADTAQRKTDKARAKELFAQHGEAMVARFGTDERIQANGGPKAIRHELDQMVKWEPAKFVKLAEKFDAEQQGTANGPQTDTAEGVTSAPEPTQTLPEDRQASRPQGAQEGAQEFGQGVGRTLEVRPSKLAAVAAHRALRKAYPEAQLEVTKQGDGWAVVDRTDDPFTDSPANAVEGAMGRLAQLQGMADAAGWSERGGKLLRDEGAEGEVTGRTKWLPTEAWFAGKPAGVTEQHMRSAVEKVASGRGILTKPERDGLAYMQETLRDLESQDRARQNEKASRTAELDALASEAAAELTEAEVEAIREQLAVQMESAAQDDYLLALKEAFHEKAIQSRTGREAGQADARGARQGIPEGRGEGGREASAFSLESQTPQDLAARDATQRETAEREQREQQERERKAQADAERGSFTLSGSDRPADVMAAQGQGGLFDGQSATPNSSEPRAEQGPQADMGADTATAEQSSEVAADGSSKGRAKAKPKLEDFGEKLEGAKKFMRQQHLDALADDALDIATEPLSKTFPAPNYAKLADEGVPSDALAFIAVARNAIPAKPRVGYKLKRWVEQVKQLRSLAHTVLSGEVTFDKMQATAEESSAYANVRGLFYTATAIKDIQPDLLPQAAKWRIEAHGGYSIYRDLKVSPGQTVYSLENPKGRDAGVYGTDAADVTERAAETIRAAVEAESDKPAERRLTKLAVYSDRYTKDIFIGFKGLNDVVRLKTGFANATDARSYIAENQDALQATIDEMRAGPQDRRPGNRPRQGPPHRDGDATPEMFASMFSFRGVQFGSYVEGDRRQAELNEAYDALMDLADVLAIPPKALSLNGSLGLAFGARGSGNAKAHFEPGNVVINLTKTKGAGSLAHEWLHALDNYLDRQSDGSGKSTGFLSNRNAAGAVRAELFSAWKAVQKAFKRGGFLERAQKYDAARSKPYWSTDIEMAARSFERYILDRIEQRGGENDYLVNVYKEGGAYPTDAEMVEQGITAAYDKLFETIDTRETGKGVALFSRDTASTGTTPDAIWSAVESLVGPLRRRRIIVVQSADVLVEQGILQSRDANGAQAFVKDGKAYFIASNIQPGNERAVFLHEVGAHLGLERILSPLQRSVLLNRIKTWAAQANGSIESRIAQAAQRRVEAAGGQDADLETVAYFVEEAVKAGINPTTDTTGPIGQWFKTLWSALRTALEKLGLVNASKLTAQDIVDLAHGAANVAMSEDAAGGELQLSRADQIDSPAFRKWFGDSVVTHNGKPMSEGGRPLVVYHGTTQDFAEFNRSKIESEGAFFFTDSHDHAAVYAGEDVEDGGSIMPIYLSLQKPYYADVMAWNLGEVPSERKLRKDGYDGMVIENQEGGTTYAAFRPEQVKSATGNSGAFSPSDPRIQFSRAASTIAPVWDVPESSKLFNRFDTDSLLYTLQDKHVDTKRVVEAIRKQSGDIADEFNPYLQEELFHGRSAKGVKDFLDSELRPLLTEMSLRKVDMATLEKFLHARHAEERNIQIAKINPKMPDGGSGMETQEARDYLAALDPAQKALLDKLAARIDAINASTRQVLVDAGLEKPETIKAWEGAYKHYVPLQREEVDSGGLGIGQGFSVKGSASKRAMGSDKAVADIIANIAMQRERAIVRAEKNRVSQALYALALKAPNPEFWMPINPAEAQAFTPKQQQTVIDELTSMGLDPADAMNFVKEPKQRYIDPRTGLVSERINPVMRSAPNVLATRINGEDRYVFFNAGDERANRMVHALKNLDADQLGRMLQTSAKLTRWFASVNTQYNPVFGAINLTRDVQGAILNLSTTPIRGQEAKVLANTFSALKGIYTDLRAIRKGGAASSQWAGLWEEFQKEGGQTGYRDMFSNATERAEAIQKELDQLGEGKLKAGGRALFDWLSDYNESMENAVRLAAYKAAKDQGISAQQAASIAKSITVNFNRKGAITTQAGALYAFFNAAVQGTTRMAQTLNGPAGRKIILGGLTLGAMQAVLLAAAGFDDEDPPEFVRERSIIIPTGGGKYISIPMPLGFHVIPSTSRILTEWALSGFKHTPKRFSDVLSLFADTFNPIGNAGWSMQTLAPTALDPLAALAENRDWSGKPIAREDFNKMTPTPGYSRAKDTASWVSKTIAYWANLATGGTDYKPGMFSPTPDQLDYLIGQFTGGVGREYLKAEQTATSVWTGEDLPPHKIPLLGRFYGDTTGQSSEANRFYSNLKEVNQHKLEIDGRRKDGGDVGEYMRDNPTARLAMVTSRFETNVRKLRQARRDAVERGDSQERIKALDAQMTTVMRQFNEQFARLDE